LAVLLYFRADIARIVAAWFRSITDRSAREDPDARMGWLVIIGTIPIVVIGLAFQDQITHAFRDLRLVAAMLIGFGVLLAIADRVGANKRELTDLNVPHGLIYGIAQCFAVIPGVSRSGGTITAGLFLGYTRAAATRYAFLLAVPAVFGSGVYELKDVGGSDSPAWGPTILATVIAFAVGFAVIAWLMRFITTRSYLPFVVYRIALGIVLFILIGTGALGAHAGPTI
jgi:undecaprenyl-diphosphatase